MKRFLGKTLQMRGLFSLPGPPALRAVHIRKLSIDIVELCQVSTLDVCSATKVMLHLISAF